MFTALLLLLAYWFFLEEMRKTSRAKFWCAAMLLGLAVLQGFHIAYFVYQISPLQQMVYGWVLLLMPISFYFFSRSVLFVDLTHQPKDALHCLPILFGVLLPTAILPIFAFFAGAGYTLWFVNVVLQLRAQSARFRFELFFFGLFAAMAVAGLFVVATIPFISTGWFFTLYTNAISLSFALVLFALLVFPELLSDIAEIAEATYAKSQLVGSNVSELRQKLEDLMISDKRYQDDELKLATLADEMDITLHQLSELINTQYGYGFRRFLREHRLRAAKALLLSEPSSSILAISMETGFKSQSAFYAAFNESEGISPGKFRDNSARR